MPEDTQHLQQLIDAHQKRLRVLEIQAAQFGYAHSPAQLIIEIQELQEKIKQLQEQVSEMPEESGNLNRIDKAVQERLSNLAQSRDPFPDINFHKAISAVEEIVSKNVQAAPAPLRSLVEIIRAAVSYGTKLFNKGLHWECAALYLHAAKKFVSLLNRPNLRPLYKRKFFLRILRNDLFPILRKYSTVPDEQASRIAWDLRRAFDAILDYSMFQEGILNLDTAFTLIETPGRRVPSWELDEVIDILYMFADDLFEHKQYAYCTELYFYTAQRFYAVLFKTEQDKQHGIHPLLHEYLNEILAYRTVGPEGDLQDTAVRVKRSFKGFHDLVGMADL